MRTWLAGEAQCPFYRRDDDHHRIVCEGITQDSSLVVKFRRQKDFALQAREFCAKSYRCCELYRMLMEKYE